MYTSNLHQAGTTGDWFKAWFDSPFYHKLYFQHDEREAGEFIERLLLKLNALPGVRMLDVACGRGRHAKVLSSKGFDVTGIDLSLVSIQEAKTAETERLHFYQHDIRMPFWINYFQYAFNFFTSFGYFKTERENYNVVRTIADSLDANGILVLDYLNVHYAEDHLVHKEEKVIDGTRFHLTRWYDETHFYKKIAIVDEGWEMPREYTERVAKFSLGDFNDMFAYHHLQLQDVFGDYHFNPYHIRNTPRLLMIAKKRLR